MEHNPLLAVGYGVVETHLQMAQLTTSIPVIWNIYLPIVNCIEKTKIKKKEAGNGQFFKNADLLNKQRKRIHNYL